MERKIPSRRHTMIRTKPPSPSPYLDPIVTRRPAGLKSESAQAGRVTVSGAVVNKQLSTANKQLESCGVKSSVCSRPGRLQGGAGDQYLQRRRTIVSADYSGTKKKDLAYLVVNLQDNLQSKIINSTTTDYICGTEGSNSANRRRNTMSGVSDKSNARKTPFRGDSLKRRFKSTESICEASPKVDTGVAQEGHHKGVATVHGYHSEKPKPGSSTTLPRVHTASSHASSATSSFSSNFPPKKSSSNRPPPPPPPPYLPPSPPKRDFSFPAGNLAECSLDSDRGMDLSVSCPNLPPRRRLSKKNQLGKTCTLSTLSCKDERAAAGLNNEQNEGASPRTPRKKYVSESMDTGLSPNATRRPPPHKPRPYSSGKMAPPPSYPPPTSPTHQGSPELSHKATSDDVDGSLKASPTSPPPLPQQTSLSTASASSVLRGKHHHEGLTSSISAPSLHHGPRSPSKSSLPSSLASHSGYSFVDKSKKPSPQDTSESNRTTSSYQHSPPPHRPVPPRPAPFLQLRSTSRPIPPLPVTPMLSSPEFGTPTKKPNRKKRSSEPAISLIKDSTASRDTRSSAASVGHSIRTRVISSPVLKSTTISLTRSQPILNSVTDSSPELLPNNPTHAAHGYAASTSTNEAIYEDLDMLVSSTAGNQKAIVQHKPALPSRNTRPSRHSAAARLGDWAKPGGVAHSNNQEQVYEELDVSDSEEYTTMDNAAYVGSLPITDAWVRIDEDGLYVDDLYVEMRPGSGSPPKEEDNSIYMEMRSTTVPASSAPTLQVMPPPPTSPAPSISRDSLCDASQVGGSVPVPSSPAPSSPAPSSPAPVYEYADLSVVVKKNTHKVAPHSSVAFESGSLYYASKDLLTSK